MDVFSNHFLTQVTVNSDAVIRDISAQALTKGDDSYAYVSGAEAHGGNAEIYFDKGLQIRNVSATVGDKNADSGASGEGAEAYAISALHGGKVIVNGSGSSASVVQLENDILSYGGGGLKETCPWWKCNFLTQTLTLLD